MPSATTSDYLHDKQMGYLLLGTTWTPATTLYVALFTTTPLLDGTGGAEVLTSGTNYARVSIAQGSGWQGPSGPNKEYSNSGELTFGVPSGNWGTITGAGLYDDPTAGHLYYVATLSSQKTVNYNDGAPKILTGQLKISRAYC